MLNGNYSKLGATNPELRTNLENLAPNYQRIYANYTRIPIPITIPHRIHGTGIFTY